MTLDSAVWLLALGVLPGVVVAAQQAGLRAERLRLLAVFCAAGLFLTALLPFAAPELWRGVLAFSGAFQDPGGMRPEHMAALSRILVPFAALLWLLTVVVTPRHRIDPAGLARGAVAVIVTSLSFLMVGSWPLLLLWLVSVWILLAGLGGAECRAARRVALAYLGSATLLLLLGCVLTAYARANGGRFEQAGVALILLAALIRKGIFPFHAWVPDIFERGRIGPATLFCAPQVGTYVVLVLAVPYAGPMLLRGVAVLALITAVYGALAALFESDARRACGYLFVSQSALVFAGLDLPGREALVGALVLWLSSGLALAGLMRCVLVLEARRGRLNLNRFHGGYERMPMLAVNFLVMGLAITSFPGTLGFVGSELLMRGAVEASPGMALLIIAAGALTGLAVLRMYFSLFCGRRDSGAHLKMKPSEGAGFAALALILIGFGLAPRPLLRTLIGFSAMIWRPSAELGLPAAHQHPGPKERQRVDEGESFPLKDAHQ